LTFNGNDFLPRGGIGPSLHDVVGNLHGGGYDVCRGPALDATFFRSWSWRVVAPTSMVEGEKAWRVASAARYHSRHIFSVAVAWKVILVILGELSLLSGGGVACPMGVDRVRSQIAPSESFPQPYWCWQHRHLDYLVGGVVVVISGSPWSSSGCISSETSIVVDWQQV
jgi:hypothetical protein